MPAPSLQEQIIADIRRQITDGSLRPGDRLPTKSELAQRWECSLQPVTMALARLEAEGLILGRQGKGTFVAEPANSRTGHQRGTGR